VLITFSGLDGAGKSTLIDWLKATLERRSQSVKVFHMNDHIGLYAYLRFARNQLAGSPEARPDGAPSPRSPAIGDDRKRGYRRLRYALIWNKTLRRLIYPLDLCVFLCYRFYHETLRRRVLIMDRYFYDTLVDVFDGRRRAWLRLLHRITPAPSLALYLDVSPEESHRRKQEQSLEYLTRRAAAYREVFAWVPSAVRIVNDDLTTSQCTLDRAVRDRLRI